MTGRLEGSVAVITGAASGIGAATARRFVTEGARVVIADLQAGPGRELESELGDCTRFIRTDVGRESDVAAAIDLAISAFGGLDVMYNNAGILGAVGPLVDVTADAWHQTVRVVLDGVFYGMKHAARVMIPQRAGSIISTASIAGLAGGVGPHAYTACKHAVVGLTKSAATELGTYGIRVNAIAPGNTVSAMTAAAISGDHTDLDTATARLVATSPAGVATVASDIADAALYLASNESRSVSGHCIVVDAGHIADAGNGRVHQYRPALIEEAGRRTLTSP